ncbi:hypothetical protein ACLMJK_009080 [Lecanora helva]
MTVNYTEEEWQAIFDKAEESLPHSPIAYNVPKPGSAAFAQMVDHTLLKTDATGEQIDRLCEEAIRYKFKSVCVRLPWIPRCFHNLQGTLVIVACVVGFPEGTHSTSSKVNEATAGIKSGASELDVVLNYPLLHHNNYTEIYTDLHTVRTAAPSSTLKVILETSQLNRKEIIAGCKIAEAAGADFVKTSTGFCGEGATRENVSLMRGVVGGSGVKVKASGGVRTMGDFVGMVEAGAERVGTSGGVGIMEEASRGDSV